MDETLRRAMRLHQGGDVAGAEALCRSILAREPGDAEASHYLGVLLAGTGRAVLALPYLQAALEANPRRGEYWLSCIEALMQVAQVEAARQMLNVAVEHGLGGDRVEALRQRLENGGERGRRPEATGASAAEGERGARDASQGSGGEKELSRGKASDGEKAWGEGHAGNSVLAVSTKGSLRAGRRGAATARNAKAKDARKKDAREKGTQGKDRARLLRLFAREKDGDLEAAAARWSALYPQSGLGWNLVGASLQRRSRFAEAEAFYWRALAADPEMAEACFNLGRLLQLRGATAEAEGFFRRAVAAHPRFLEGHYSLGEVLSQRRKFAEAEASYRRALAIKPSLAVAHNNLAIALCRQGRPGEGEDGARQALKASPRLAEAWSTLGSALEDQGRLDEAAAAYREAVGLKPELAAAWHGLLFCLSHGGETEPAALYAEHLRFAERFEAPLRAGWPQHGNGRDPERVLQVGFVSGDFRQHSMANFTEPMLAQLGKVDGLELHAYSNGAAEDAVTERIRNSVRHWNRVFALSDEALAEKIRADGIDILVDLTGHTADNRLLTFARKPAPLQCGWIGYLGTSGLRSMDYYLADRWFLPPGEFDRFFTEKIAYLSAVAPFGPTAGAPEVNSLPALGNGCLTFGSFSRISKLSRAVIAVWSELLRAVPGARMLLAGMPAGGGDALLRRWFEEEGIGGERLEFHARCGTAQYLALHYRVDLCLDPFPFTGATTTGNALWMGVPTLTLAGRTVPGRLGAAMLCHMGLEEFVARSREEFVEKGILWAGRWEELSALRAGMRERFLRSPIGQPELVAASLAETLREMWRAWCTGAGVAHEDKGAG